MRTKEEEKAWLKKGKKTFSIVLILGLSAVAIVLIIVHIMNTVQP